MFYNMHVTVKTYFFLFYPFFSVFSLFVFRYISVGSQFAVIKGRKKALFQFLFLNFTVIRKGYST